MKSIRMSPRLSLPFIMLAALIFSPSIRAQVPQLINYQGRVVVEGTNFDGTASFKFAFVSGSGSNTFWSNDGTSVAGSQPSASVTLAVSKGLFSVLLGDAALSNMAPISSAVFTNSDVRLRTWFNDGVHGFQQLPPDQRIAAVGYAMMSANVPDSSITASKLGTNAVTTLNIAEGAVTSSKIGSGAVGTTQLGLGAVTADKIATGAISSTQLANPYESGSTNTAGIVLDHFESYQDLTVVLNNSYDIPPIVTATLASSSGGDQFTSSPTLTGTTISNFVLRLPLTYSATEIERGDRQTNKLGQTVSLAEVNGRPSVTYSRNNGSLSSSVLYARSSDSDGAEWPVPVTVLTTNYTYSGSMHPSLATVAGNPAIAFRVGDNSPNGIHYIRASDSNGMSWGSPVMVIEDSLNKTVGELIVANGNPAIVFTSYDGSTNIVKFVRATDANGSSWGSPINVVTQGTQPSVSLVNGNPAIAYNDQGSSIARYVRASNANGTTWGTPQLVTSNASYPSLSVVNGRPAVAFQGSYNTIKFIRANDANGATWGNIVMVTEGGEPSFPRLGVVSGVPAIVYLLGDPDGVSYVRASDADGTNWTQSVTVFQNPHSGSILYDPVFTVVNGLPAISFGTETRETLYFLNPTLRDKPVVNWIAVRP